MNLAWTVAAVAKAHGFTLALVAHAPPPSSADTAPASPADPAALLADARLDAQPPVRTECWQCDGTSNYEARCVLLLGFLFGLSLALWLFLPPFLTLPQPLLISTLPCSWWRGCERRARFRRQRSKKRQMLIVVVLHVLLYARFCHKRFYTNFATSCFLLSFVPFCSFFLLRPGGTSAVGGRPASLLPLPRPGLRRRAAGRAI